MNTKKALMQVAGAIAALYSASALAVCTPLVIDLGKNGINLGAKGVGVLFDVNGDYVPERVQWLRPGGDEAFLSLDRNDNGLVDDGSELFGEGTPLWREQGRAVSGFVALAQFDQPSLGGNDDGLITSADRIWPSLSIWKDSNADGISTTNEMLTPTQAGLTAFQTIPKRKKYFDEAGNLIPFWAWATSSTTPTKVIFVDVYFQVLEERVSSCERANQSDASA